MRLNKKLIFAISAVLVVAIIYGIFLFAYTPSLPEREKAKIEALRSPIIWYDENGHVEENNVWRYIGKYGDCYAFLQFGNGEDPMFQPVKLPFELLGLSYPVYYPKDAYIFLYHTKREFPDNEVFGDSPYTKETHMIRMTTLMSIENREEWISDWQLKRLTRDLERIAWLHK